MDLGALQERGREPMESYKFLAIAFFLALDPLFTGTGSAQELSSKSLKKTELAAIFAACQSTAAATNSALRTGKKTKMWCAIVDRDGKLLLIESTDTNGSPQNPKGSDAWRGSIEIAEAKAYTALAFSSNDQALDSKTVGLLTRPDGPGSTAAVDIGTNAGVAPLWGLGNTNPFRTLGGGPGDDSVGKDHHGIVTFAGGQPLYDCSSHSLLGGVGVSGDGVDQDDTIAKGAATGAGFCVSP
jgi:uncharacterized protein GlcG (DUF336 family)